MLWVGLTGGIASGKSTVSHFLHREGAYIIDADQIVHALLCDKGVVYDSVLKAFGEIILDHERKIDRKRLGALVFRNPDQRQRLNQIVHPYVFKKAETEKKAIHAKNPKAVIVFDAALLIETGAYKKMDWVLLAYVDPETQIQRLIKRDHLSKEDALLRISAQMPIDEKVALADEVIRCNEPLNTVKTSLHQVYARLKEKAGDNRPSA